MPLMFPRKILYAAAFACATLACTLHAEDEVPDTGKPVDIKVPAGPAVTDAQVVASMRKGIDFLLSIKKVDNWESLNESRNPGGESALVLYALLHAGDSLQDDPEYHAKLHWRSAEMAPAVPPWYDR